MKYKNLKSFLHNFSHSFVSYDNYFGDEYIIEEFLSRAREVEGETVSVQWLPKCKALNIKLSEKAEESLIYYQQWLPMLAKQHEVELSAIESYQTDIAIGADSKIIIIALSTDDRGTVYEQQVRL